MGTLPTVSQAPADFLTNTACQVVPGTIPWGPGWFLVSTNGRVEAGPFLTEETAFHSADWLEDNGLGVHPAPWTPRWSSSGLLIGSRVRDRRRLAESLADAG